ncbi:pentapeptide repeat-containing protein [Streptomyces sp. NPDC017254]|uniref:pentapeptide repeat-containing protein n=1 Tax=unclassified Streptomyces TaxID=2593676 RepID=UPI00378E33E4
MLDEEPSPSADIRATVTLLGDRRSDLDQAVQIGLSDTDLRGLHLHGADFGWTDLGGADLSGAILFDVDFQSAWQTRAKLPRAYLWSTNLSDADVYDADLTDARFCAVVLDGETTHECADLNGARLIRANLTGADLTRADLSTTELRVEGEGEPGSLGTGARLLSARAQ